MKVIKSSENRGILLKGSTTKIISKEGRFLNFLRPSMTAGLQVKKSALIPLAESILLLLESSPGMSTTDAVIKKNRLSGTTALIFQMKKSEF